MFISERKGKWWKEDLVKHEKLSKYYENDCSPLTIWNSQDMQIIKKNFLRFFLEHIKMSNLREIENLEEIIENLETVTERYEKIIN